MAKIPDDIMRTAREVYDGLIEYAGDDIGRIALAIMAERKRCAKIVRCGCDNPSCELDRAADRIERGDQP